MLYKFKSPATADLIMLQPHGRRILEIIGKEGAPAQGILLPAQMPAAIAALEAAITREETEQKAAAAEAAAHGQDAPGFDSVSLRQRVTPFIEMLRRCEKAEKEIVWGV